MNAISMFIVAAMAVMLVGATALATEDAFADKKKYDKNQATSLANACGNDKLPMYVFCQNTGSQVQGDENAVAIEGVQRSEDHKDKKDANPKIPPSNTDLAKLGDAWWQWAYNLDTEDVGNPFLDNSLSCTLGQQSGGLLFLTGTAGIFTPEGGVEQGETDFMRSCTVKAGTQLFIPLLVTECSPIEFGLNGPCGNTPEELRASANELMNPDFINSLTLEIDGVSVPKEKLLQYNRAESPGDGFSLTIAPNNAFGLNANTMVPPPVTLPATVNSVAVGYWALLHSLAPGEHTIKFGGSITYPEQISGTFRTSVTYLLNVVP
jgi:hypothetical protein